MPRPRRACLSGYMTLRQLAEQLGMGRTRHAARKLARQVARRERAIGKTIIQRDPSKPNAPGLISIPLLRQFLPHLVLRREEIGEELRELVNGLRDQIIEAKLRDRALAARIRQQAAEISATAARVSELERLHVPRAAGAQQAPVTRGGNARSSSQRSAA